MVMGRWATYQSLQAYKKPSYATVAYFAGRTRRTQSNVICVPYGGAEVLRMIELLKAGSTPAGLCPRNMSIRIESQLASAGPLVQQPPRRLAFYNRDREDFVSKKRQCVRRTSVNDLFSDMTSRTHRTTSAWLTARLGPIMPVLPDLREPHVASRKSVNCGSGATMTMPATTATAATIGAAPDSSRAVLRCHVVATYFAVP